MIPVGVLAAAKNFGSLLFKNWRWVLIFGLVIYIGVLKLALKDEQLHGTKLSRALSEQVAANDKLKNDVKAQRALAAAADKANAMRVERDQVVVSQEKIVAYQTEISALRARAAQRVRPPRAPANSVGGGGKPPVPSVPDAAGRADAPAGEDGLSDADKLIASEIALRLKYLQQWVDGQLGVER